MVLLLRVLALQLCVVVVWVAADDSDAEVCSSTMCYGPQDLPLDVAHEGSLLQAFARARSKTQMLSDQVKKHRAWRAEHSRISQAVDKSKDSLDDFIEEQKESTDHCSARLMEAKRSLDGLFHDLKALSDETSSHETILETETENLNVTHMSIEAVEIQYKEETNACKKQQQEAIEEVDQYKDELEELNQIAKPKVRYHPQRGIVEKNMKSKELEDALDEAVKAAFEIEPKKDNATAEASKAPKVAVNEPVAAPAEIIPEPPQEAEPIIMQPNERILPTQSPGLDVNPLADAPAPTKGGPALSPSVLQTGTFSKESCLAFLEYQKRHHHRRHSKGQQGPEPPLEEERKCNKQRKELQEAFTKAYKTVQDLLEAAKARVADVEDCYQTAKAKKSGEEVPLVSQREVATGRIEQSAAALAALEPVLHLVDQRAERLQTHIDEDLAPECKQAAKVSETLQEVRELILSLERCPGRNDFRLQIPTEDDEDEDEEKNDEQNNNDNELAIKKDLGKAAMLTSKHSQYARHSQHAKHSQHSKHPKAVHHHHHRHHQQHHRHS